MYTLSELRKFVSFKKYDYVYNAKNTRQKTKERFINKLNKMLYKLSGKLVKQMQNELIRHRLGL